MICNVIPKFLIVKISTFEQARVSVILKFSDCTRSQFVVLQYLPLKTHRFISYRSSIPTMQPKCHAIKDLSVIDKQLKRYFNPVGVSNEHFKCGDDIQPNWDDIVSSLDQFLVGEEGRKETLVQRDTILFRFQR
ncbi:hypothetical protein CDAR_88021 [Caerostris darwini]|uniref:Uncharacterized protein n=1 Tax=Caerostris darwini TaxID=1538125 RepID=A0AAV4S2V3_9ARAC|nr:hypothetical protein CDAR_88021 [Caerostris darwini]